MPLIEYVSRRFSSASLALIETANEIIDSYRQQGYKLTLRQLYYQFVARDIIPNKVSEYKRLGSVINDARLAGLIDWTSIEDRTRSLARVSTWSSPANIVGSAASSYRTDKWAGQPTRVEVWIEKEALAGVFERVCETLEVPYLSCRGYTSQSEMWGASQRMIATLRTGQNMCVLHFGDHDPSGIDMSRDIQDRLHLFGVNSQRGEFTFKRIALNMPQIDQYGPPPNPAKETDSRFEEYRRTHGDESWELDALEPSVLSGLVMENVFEFRDLDLWKESHRKQERERHQLSAAAEKWPDLVDFMHLAHLDSDDDDDDDTDEGDVE